MTNRRHGLVNPPPARPGGSASNKSDRRPSPRRAVGPLLLLAAVSGLVAPLAQPDRSAPPWPRQRGVVHAQPQVAWEQAVPRHVFYASPSGRPDNPGTQSEPLDLARALSAEGPLRPGDLLWLRAGTYVGNFRSSLTGTHAAYIVVSAFPGERAILDGAPQPHLDVLRVDGSHTVFWGLEITNSEPAGASRRGTGIDVFGPYTKVINSVVHHTGNGIGVWTPALEAEIYGNLIYAVGWDDGGGGGHGHSVYVQNDALTKRLVDNVLFDGRSYGIHAFTVLGQINNLHIEGNIAFDHGSRSSESGAKANVLVGGRQLAERPVLVSNYAYYPWTSVGRNLDVGYINGCSSPLIRKNYLAGGTPIALKRCSDVTMQHNQFVGRVDAVTASRYRDNEYTASRPTKSLVAVRANRYQRGRGHVAIFNWERLRDVSVDLSTLGLVDGEPFSIHDVRDVFARPLVEGTYGASPVRVPLDRIVRVPWSDSTTQLPAEFAAVLVLPQPAASSPDLPWTPRNNAPVVAAGLRSAAEARAHESGHGDHR